MAHVTAVAIVCVRNEALHIRRCVRDFVRQSVDVILIDHDSTDGSMDIAQEFLGKGLLAIERLPWCGTFSLSEQLSFKKHIANTVAHDWVIHADADEWLRAPDEHDSLIDGIRTADEAGFNCINFLEFVFVPRPGENFELDDYPSVMRDYYFFAPRHPQLMRAWKRSAGLDQHDGGHLLIGKKVRLFPRDFPLRHYIVLSEAHARRKYFGRRFAAEELAKGWHVDRTMINDQNVSVRSRLPLLTLEDPQSSALSTAYPTRLHFWEWS